MTTNVSAPPPTPARTVERMAPGYLTAVEAEAYVTPSGDLSVWILLTVVCPRCGQPSTTDPGGDAARQWPSGADLDRWAAAYAVELAAYCENANPDDDDEGEGDADASWDDETWDGEL